MKETPFQAYEKIFDALLEVGYSEEEAEQLICDVIEDNLEMNDIAKRIHRILESSKENKKYN